VDLDLLKYFHFFSQYFCTISGEQCRKSPAKYYRKRQMVECMTRKVLREGRALADLTYEIEMVEMKKAKVESKLMFDTVGGTTVPKNKQLLEQWSSLCKIRMTLLAKQDFSKQTLYRYVKSVFMIHVGGTRCVPSSTFQYRPHYENTCSDHLDC
jgi:hypothetical protein